MMMTRKCEHCGDKFLAYPNRKGTTGTYPRFCSRKCYTASRREQAMATIKIPDRFWIVHLERALPTPTDIGDFKNHVLIRRDDPAIGELLDDAEHYAHPSGPDSAPRGVIASAKATVRAIRNVIGWDDACPAIKALQR